MNKNVRRRGEMKKTSILVCQLHLINAIGRGRTYQFDFFFFFRKSSSPNVGSSSVIRNRQLDGKRIKPDGQVLAAKTSKCTEKMIELDFVSSEEDF